MVADRIAPDWLLKESDIANKGSIEFCLVLGMRHYDLIVVNTVEILGYRLDWTEKRILVTFDSDIFTDRLAIAYLLGFDHG